MNHAKQTKDYFIAGFIRAGGDVEDAKDQADQFVKCTESEGNYYIKMNRKNNAMSPSDLEVLIHYHCDPYQYPRYDDHVVVEATKKFLQDDIIKVDNRSDSGYSTTEKGKAWINMILKTPHPVQCWVDENGNKVG